MKKMFFDIISILFVVFLFYLIIYFANPNINFKKSKPQVEITDPKELLGPLKKKPF